jgi:transcriptional regulator with XRE-family HTH domain
MADTLFSIGRRMALIRTQSGLSQEWLAGELGVSTTTVSKWECGEMDPRASRIPYICAALSCSADELFGLAAYHAPAEERERASVAARLRRASIAVVRVVARVISLDPGLPRGEA